MFRGKRGARSRKSATMASSSQRVARAVSEAAPSTPAPVHPSQRYSLEQLLAQQNYGAYVPTFCLSPPYPGGVDFLRAGGVAHGASGLVSGGGTPAVAAVGDSRAGVTRESSRRRRGHSALWEISVERRRRRRERSRSQERRDVSRSRLRHSRSPLRVRSRSPKWRNPWRR